MCPAWHPGAVLTQKWGRKCQLTAPKPPALEELPGRGRQLEDRQQDPANWTSTRRRRSWKPIREQGSPAGVTTRVHRSCGRGGHRARWPLGHSPAEAMRLSRVAPGGGAQSPRKLGCLFPLPPPPRGSGGTPLTLSGMRTVLRLLELTTNLQHVPALWSACVPALWTTDEDNSVAGSVMAPGTG